MRRLTTRLPQKLPVWGVDLGIVAGEVTEDRAERRQDSRRRTTAANTDPDPRGQATIEDARRDEASAARAGLRVGRRRRGRRRRRVARRRVRARRDREVAHPVGRGDLQDQVAGQHDAEVLQETPRRFSVARAASSDPGQDIDVVGVVVNEVS